jgi:hypothetical protein
MAEFDALAAPPAALEKGGVEIMRGAIVEGTLQLTLRPAFADPQAWGMVLADIARNVARIHAIEHGRSESETIDRIRDMLESELNALAEGDSPREIS